MSSLLVCDRLHLGTVSLGADMEASNEEKGEIWCRYCHEPGFPVSLHVIPHSLSILTVCL
jgi:hypothetical protein